MVPLEEDVSIFPFCALSVEYMIRINSLDKGKSAIDTSFLTTKEIDLDGNIPQKIQWTVENGP